MTQLVVSGNRIMAHGEDCFLAMGGTVICTETGRKFENATVVNHDGAIPSDIDSVGYEYHAGEFVPCAPFGKGTGNIAVLCGDTCKSLKDSGISVANICKAVILDYKGDGRYEVSLPLDSTLPGNFIPLFVSVSAVSLTSSQTSGYITPKGGMATYIDTGDSTPETTVTALASSFDGNKITWNCHGDDVLCMNQSGVIYRAVVFGLEVGA